MTLHEIFDRLPVGHITTIAGAPYREGVEAKEAHVGWPIGIARNNDGDLVIVDWHGNRLWCIDGEGILHSFAGTGMPGNSGDGGPKEEAQFQGPHSLARDKSGNLYMADLHSETIRRIDAKSGIITRVAGSGRSGQGGDGGLVTEAELYVHCGLALDDDGNLYLSGEWTNNIRKVDAKTGVIDLWAGHRARHYASETSDGKMPFVGAGLEDWSGLTWGGYHGDGGPKEDAAFFHPEHLAFDSKGDLYICDNSNNRIRKIDMTTGIITTVFGTGMPASNGDGGPATEAGTLMPDALCFDVHDNMYVGEKYGYRVRKVSGEDGIVTTLVGNGVPGWGEEGLHGSETHCNSVEAGIWADPDGTVFWCDCSGRVRRYDGETGIVTTVLGGTSIHDGEPATQGFLAAPNGLAVGPDGTIYFGDYFNQRVRSIDPDGVIHTVAGSGARGVGGDHGPATEAHLSNPLGASVDSSGRIVIADGRHGFVRRIDEQGIITALAGTGIQWDKGDGGPATAANLLSVTVVAHDADNNIYLSDSTAHRVRRIDAVTGIITTIVGTGQPGYTGDGGPAAEARIAAVNAIQFDDAGNLYIADSGNHVIRKIDIGGIITTIVGIGEQGFSPDGTPATGAKLDTPNGLAVTRDGVVYICDSSNNRVRRIASDNTLETVAGSNVQGNSGENGPATNASLNQPYGLSLYDDDILLISDYFNNQIKAVKLS
jgi:sugar lactone lactonase YvrE